MLNTNFVFRMNQLPKPQIDFLFLISEEAKKPIVGKVGHLAQLSSSLDQINWNKIQNTSSENYIKVHQYIRMTNQAIITAKLEKYLSKKSVLSSPIRLSSLTISGVTSGTEDRNRTTTSFMRE